MAWYGRSMKSTSIIQLVIFVSCIILIESHQLDQGDLVWHSSSAVQDGNCTEAMFPGDQFATWACQAQLVFQMNWFPSPISGLFSYQTWNGFDGFWQNGCVLETFANFMAYGKHQRYRTVVRKSLRSLSELCQAYYPSPSYDDMAWYGLSYLRIYEVLGDKEFLDMAKDIYDWTWTNGWDSTGACGGGMWFDQGKFKKITITNVQMLQLGSKLYITTGSTNTTLLSTIHKLWSYLEVTHTINNQTYLVSDRLNLTTCLSNGDYSHTYSSGVLAGGLMYTAQAFNDSTYIDLAHKILNATIFYRSKNGIFYEPCDLDHSCDDDQKVFKGIFVRNLRYVMDMSDTQTAARYKTWLESNGKSILNKDICTGDPRNCNLVFKDGPPSFPPMTPVFDSIWGGPFNYSAPMQQASALDLFVSLIRAGTECQGVSCRYDPPVLPPQPLTCRDDPCPAGHQCCEYQGGYRTCCTPQQTCINGFCE